MGSLRKTYPTRSTKAISPIFAAMKKTLLSLILLACLGVSQRATAQNEDRVHSATVVELGLHSRLAYHQALPLGLVASAHAGYELHTNPVGFLDKENSAPLEYTFPMLLPTAGIELRWYTGREKSQEEINSGLYVVAGGDVQTRTAGVVFNRLYRGPWRYRYGAKAGLGLVSVLGDVIHAKIEIGGRYSSPFLGSQGSEYFAPYGDIGIGIKL